MAEWVEAAYWLPALGTFEQFLTWTRRDRAVMRKKLIAFTSEIGGVSGHPGTDRKL